MNSVSAFVNSIDWRLVVACLSLIVAILGHRLALRAYKRNAPSAGISVRATINKDIYRDGWRSVQIHIGPADDNYQNFRGDLWRIVRARLARPLNAVLARAQDDDYASRVFYDDNPVRKVEGRAENKPQQRNTLEFFVKFEGADDRGKRAKFVVTFSRADGRNQRTEMVWATVPTNAEPPLAAPKATAA